jgi:hypothetical protein
VQPPSTLACDFAQTGKGIYDEKQFGSECSISALELQGFPALEPLKWLKLDADEDLKLGLVGL